MDEYRQFWNGLVDLVRAMHGLARRLRLTSPPSGQTNSAPTRRGALAAAG
jgi:hypothetical protein